MAASSNQQEGLEEVLVANAGGGWWSLVELSRDQQPIHFYEFICTDICSDIFFFIRHFFLHLKFFSGMGDGVGEGGGFISKRIKSMHFFIYFNSAY